MRLVDAERMRNDDSMCEGVLCDECPFADRLRSKCSFVDFMDRQPTIDPVKHGRWVNVVDEYVGAYKLQKMLRCSECNYEVWVVSDGTNPKYCSNCGAKMDGGTEDEVD